MYRCEVVGFKEAVLSYGDVSVKWDKRAKIVSGVQETFQCSTSS